MLSLQQLLSHGPLEESAQSVGSLPSAKSASQAECCPRFTGLTGLLGQPMSKSSRELLVYVKQLPCFSFRKGLAGFAGQTWTTVC